MSGCSGSPVCRAACNASCTSASRSWCSATGRSARSSRPLTQGVQVRASRLIRLVRDPSLGGGTRWWRCWHRQCGRSRGVARCCSGQSSWPAPSSPRLLGRAFFAGRLRRRSPSCRRLRRGRLRSRAPSCRSPSSAGRFAAGAFDAGRCRGRRAFLAGRLAAGAFFAGRFGAGAAAVPAGGTLTGSAVAAAMAATLTVRRAAISARRSSMSSDLASPSLPTAFWTSASTNCREQLPVRLARRQQLVGELASPDPRRRKRRHPVPPARAAPWQWPGPSRAWSW